MADERLLEGVDIFANASFPQTAPMLRVIFTRTTVVAYCTRLLN